MVTRFAPLVALLALGACTFPEAPLPPGERHIVVHAILDPSTRIQTIQLSTTFGTAESIVLDSASVVVTTPDGRELAARQDSTVSDFGSKSVRLLPIYHLYLDDYGVDLLAGYTYTLRVVTRSGDTISGATTIPNAAPAALETTTNFFVRGTDTLRLSWPDVLGAEAYEAQLWAATTCAAGSRCFANRRLTQSLFTNGPLTLAGMSQTLGGDAVFPQNSTMTVAVLAVDINYREYYRDLGDPFAGAAPSRLTGGLGVFGSVVPIVLKRFEVR